MKAVSPYLSEMCISKPHTERDIAQHPAFIGATCPECGDGSKIDYMKFVDRHGMERVDPEVFECTARRHSFATVEGGLRIISSDGKLARPSRDYECSTGGLRPKSLIQKP